MQVTSLVTAVMRRNRADPFDDGRVPEAIYRALREERLCRPQIHPLVPSDRILENGLRLARVELVDNLVDRVVREGGVTTTLCTEIRVGDLELREVRRNLSEGGREMTRGVVLPRALARLDISIAIGGRVANGQSPHLVDAPGLREVEAWEAELGPDDEESSARLRREERFGLKDPEGDLIPVKISVSLAG